MIKVNPRAKMLTTISCSSVVYYQPLLNSWDCLAGLLLVSEAGGVTNDFLAETGLRGRGDVFAAAPQIADRLMGIIKGGELRLDSAATVS